MAHANVSRKNEKYINKRKDSKMSFAKNQLLTARCETIDSIFSVSVPDLSPSGAFICTQKKLRPGQEIAMTINLPDSDEFVMVTGEIVRKSSEGYGVKFKIIFSE